MERHTQGGDASVEARRPEFDGKKADNPHRGRRQGDPATFDSAAKFRYAGSSSTSLSRWITQIRRVRNASGTATRVAG